MPQLQHNTRVSARKDAHAGSDDELPLMISSLIRHADRCHADAEIVSRTVEGPIHRYTYRDAHARARRLAKALARLGVAEGDRVGDDRLERLPPFRALLRPCPARAP
jgi:long-subunit acyl-CoA synthetase (AMP-forming)